MPGPRLVNGTFREFSDGFVELGIPRTGLLATAAFLTSVPHPPPSLPLCTPLKGSPFLSGPRVSRIRADSIKRWFAAAKRRVERFVGNVSPQPPRYLPPAPHPLLRLPSLLSLSLAFSPPLALSFSSLSSSIPAGSFSG